MNKFEKAQSYFHQGLEHHRNGEYAPALALYRKSIALVPKQDATLANMALLLLQTEQYRESIAAGLQALDLSPKDQAIQMRIEFCEVMASLTECDWTQRDKLLARMEAKVAAGNPDPEPYVMTLLSHSQSLHQQIARLHVQTHYPPTAPLYSGQRYRHSKIRIAYLSTDFRDHAVSFLLTSLFEQHDRSRFETMAVSFGRSKAGQLRERLEAAFDHFVDATYQDDQAIARMLQAWEADIVVDLNGYTTDCRPRIFAQRPAPVQVSYIGYPGTMGAPYFDYLIADEVVIPPQNAAYFDEHIVYMPATYQYNDRQRQPADLSFTRKVAGLPAEGVVFCCFNNNFKIAPAWFALWMRLLQQTPGSVLWLLANTPTVERNLRKEARKHGITPDRILFAPRVDYPKYLARFALADIFLDTQPYTGHATASDALWMGLPVVTMRGEAFPGRVAASLLTALEMPELITDTPEAYEALCLKLASEPETLRLWREKLLRQRETAPLFDADAFRHALEAAYIEIHRRHEAGEAPSDIQVRELKIPPPRK